MMLTYNDWCTWRDEHFGDDGIIAPECLIDMPEEFEGYLEHDVGLDIVRSPRD